MATLHLGDDGPDVKNLQREVNKQLENREFPWRTIKTDSRFGEETQTACHFTGWILGFSPSQLTKIKQDGTITHHAYAILVHEKARSDAQKKRERERRPTVKKFKFLHHHPERRHPNGVGSFDGVPVARWMIRWLRKSRANGWNGVLVSGYRSPQHSEQLCLDMCGQPSCPGMCAGTASNHSGRRFPEGAVDVSDEATFAAVQRRIGSPLKNDLPSDRVHFSVTGH